MKKPVKVLLITGSIIVLLPIVFFLAIIGIIYIVDAQDTKDRQQKIEAFNALSQEEKNQRVPVNLLDSIVGVPMPTFNVDSCYNWEYVDFPNFTHAPRIDGTHVKKAYELLLSDDISSRAMQAIKRQARKQEHFLRFGRTDLKEDVYTIVYGCEYGKNDSIIGERVVNIYPKDRKVQLFTMVYNDYKAAFMNMSQEEKNRLVESNLLDSLIGGSCPAFDVTNYFFLLVGGVDNVTIEEYVLTLKSAFPQSAIKALNDSVRISEDWTKEDGVYHRNSDYHLYIYPEKRKVVKSRFCDINCCH